MGWWLGIDGVVGNRDVLLVVDRRRCWLIMMQYFARNDIHKQYYYRTLISADPAYCNI